MSRSPFYRQQTQAQQTPVPAGQSLSDAAQRRQDLFAHRPDAPPLDASGPFLVFPGGECVPIDGPLRAALLRDDWYVIGECSTIACGSERAARDALRQLIRQRDPHQAALDAVADLDSAKLELV